MYNQELYTKALRFAAVAHGDQKVPGSNMPYLVHICLVASEAAGVLFREKVANPDLLMQCALLHDTIEDTDTSPSMIRDTFGEEVADGVTALSKNKVLPKSQAMEESLERILLQPHEIWMVKLADRVTNLQPPPAHWDRPKCQAYREEAVTIHGTLKEASMWLSERLSSKIEEYAQYC